MASSRLTGLSCAALLTLTAAPAFAQSAPEVFQRALRVERVEGDLREAVRLYGQVVEMGDRALSARALLRMGESLERIGGPGAEEAYRRLVAEFGDQAVAADEARARLAVLTASTTGIPGTPDGIVIRQLRSDMGATVGSVSPDGREVAFIDWDGEGEGLRGHTDVAVLDLASGTFRLVTDRPSQRDAPAYPERPTWSRDGRFIAYAEWAKGFTHQRLRIVTSDGSSDRILVTNELYQLVHPMDWSPQGDFIATLIRGWDDVWRIAVVSVADGSVSTLKTFGTHSPFPVSVSPDGRYLVYDYLEDDDSSSHDIFVMATDGSSERVLVGGQANDDRPFFTPDGGWVVFRSDRAGSRGIWAVPVQDGAAAGEPEPVRPDVGPMVTGGLTASGGLYYNLPIQETDVAIAEVDWADRGRLNGLRPATDRFVGTNRFPDFSPDGQRLAYVSVRGPGESPEAYLVVKSLLDGEERPHRLGFDIAGRYERPEWTSDGRRVLLGAEVGSYSVDAVTGEMTRISAVRDLAGEGGPAVRWATDVQAERLRSVDLRILSARPRDMRRLENGELPLPPGEEVLFPNAGFQRGITPIMSDQDLEPFGPVGHVHTWALSPNGSTLAVAVASDPEREVSDVLWLMTLDDREIREVARLSEEREFVSLLWTPDGETIVFGTATGATDLEGEIWRLEVAGGETERLVTELTARELAELTFHPDGRRVAYTREESRTELWIMEGLPWQASPSQ